MAALTRAECFFYRALRVLISCHLSSETPAQGTCERLAGITLLAIRGTRHTTSPRKDPPPDERADPDRRAPDCGQHRAREGAASPPDTRPGRRLHWRCRARGRHVRAVLLWHSRSGAAGRDRAAAGSRLPACHRRHAGHRPRCRARPAGRRPAKQAVRVGHADCGASRGRGR